MILNKIGCMSGAWSYPVVSIRPTVAESLPESMNLQCTLHIQQNLSSLLMVCFVSQVGVHRDAQQPCNWTMGT